jgi:3-keto-5-aminohexanoate cleavage enzyme
MHPKGEKYGPNGIDLDFQPKWDIPDKIMISCMVTGQPIKRAKNPNQPYTPDEVREAAMNCIEAGATAVHIHARTDEGNFIVDKKEHIRRMHQIIDPIREKYGYGVVIDGCMCIDSTFENEKMLIDEGLTEIVPLNPSIVGPQELMQAEASYLQEKGVLPALGLHSESSVDVARVFLIDTGLLKLPTHWGLLPMTGVGQTLYDQFEAAEYVIRMARRIRKIDPDAVISVPTAGRASYYLASLGILMGLHLRVGIEDTYWKWPHKEDRLDSTVTAYKDLRRIAETLGRQQATADEYRAMVGLPKKGE